MMSHEDDESVTTRMFTAAAGGAERCLRSITNRRRELSSAIHDIPFGGHPLRRGSLVGLGPAHSGHRSLTSYFNFSASHGSLSANRSKVLISPNAGTMRLRKLGQAPSAQRQQEAVEPSYFESQLIAGLRLNQFDSERKDVDDDEGDVEASTSTDITAPLTATLPWPNKKEESRQSQRVDPFRADPMELVKRAARDTLDIVAAPKVLVITIRTAIVVSKEAKNPEQLSFV